MQEADGWGSPRGRLIIFRGRRSSSQPGDLPAATRSENFVVNLFVDVATDGHAVHRRDTALSRLYQTKSPSCTNGCVSRETAISSIRDGEGYTEEIRITGGVCGGSLQCTSKQSKCHASYAPCHRSVQ